jgi:uncharacterized membrane protein
MFTTVLLIAGLVVIAAGIVLLFVATSQKPPPNVKSESIVTELTDAIKALNDYLDKFEQKFRIGVLLVTIGAAMVGLAAYFEAKDAKDTATKAAPAALVRTTS